MFLSDTELEQLTGTKQPSKMIKWLGAQHSKCSRGCRTTAGMQFVKDRALVLISFWSALEGLFLTNTQELRFRLGAYLASYLEKPGPERMVRYKKILTLYDHRSKAAHGKPKNDPQALAESFLLLRDVVIRIIEAKHIPTQKELEAGVLSIAPD